MARVSEIDNEATMLKEGEGAVRFVTVATQRSGSTWLTDLLNSHPEVASYTELLLPEGKGVPEWGKYKDVLYWRSYREEMPSGLVRVIRPLGLYRYLDEVFSRHQDKSAVGMKLMYGQLVRLPETLIYLRSRRVRVVHLLRRNLLDVILSGMAKAVRAQAHAHAGDRVEQVRAYVDPSWLLQQLKRRGRQQRAFAQLLRHLGVPYHEIVYEDIVSDPSALTACMEFIGCEPRTLVSDMTKLNPARHPDFIENFSEVEAKLANTPFAALLRT